jgi:hypothetical protein
MFIRCIEIRVLAKENGEDNGMWGGRGVKS